MQYTFNAELLSKEVKIKRIIKMNIGLREVAEKTKVSAATLCRLENKCKSDIDTFLKVCSWLNMSPMNFITAKKKQ